MPTPKSKKKTTQKTVKKKAEVKQGPGKGRQGASSASRYTVDSMPERALADMAAAPVPRATASGQRAGIPSPSTRSYGGDYTGVDATTAVSRATARQNGELAPISGGLDDAETEGEMQVQSDFDPLGDPAPIDAEIEPGDAMLLAEEQELARREVRGAVRHDGVSAPTNSAPVAALSAPEASGVPYSLLEPSIRISLELSDGTMTMPAIRVLPGAYGVTILLPLSDDGVTFIPKPGSSVTVGHNNERWPCYFPGTYFEWPELQCMGLVFVRSDDDDPETA
jgi:hypothetical protein